MTTLFQDVANYGDAHSSAYAFEGPGRPRAATVSFRYMAPHSPVYKPAVSPPNSPPSLILPPANFRNGGLTRSLSKLSCFDERLASSAPPMSRVLSAGSSLFESTNAEHNPNPLNEVFGTNPEFQLIEDDLADYFTQPSPGAIFVDGLSATADSFPYSKEDTGDATMESPVPFSASPVLISCLRNIARTRLGDI